jgi:ADP-heptose:LPS heptosyltransferase
MGWGDEIIVTGMARRMQLRDPRPVRVRDRKGRARWSEIWAGNPRLAAPGDQRPAQELLSGPGLRPYVARETPGRWEWRAFVCPVGEIHLTAAERRLAAPHAGRVLLEPNLKPGASPNKDWGWARWQALATALAGEGVRVAQFARPGARLLAGAEPIVVPSFRAACAVLARARLAVLPEGGLHHAAAALGTPSIVLFGGFISPDQTGYPHQANLFTGGVPCGMRTRCRHCAAAMGRIAVETVMAEAGLLLEATRDMHL